MPYDFTFTASANASFYMTSESLRRQLASQSRDRNFLIRSSLIIVAIAVIISYVTSHSFSAATDEASAENTTTSMQLSEEHLIEFIRFGVSFLYLDSDETLHCLYLKDDWDRSVHKKAIEKRLSVGENTANTEIIQIWMNGLMAENPTPSIQQLEGMPADSMFRDEFLGDLFVMNDNHERALESFLSATERATSSRYAIRSAVALAHYNEDRQLLRELLADAKIEEILEVGSRIDYYTYLRDYPNLGIAILESEINSWRSPYLIHAMMTAIIWGLILSSFWTPSRTRVAMSLIAFALGVFSASLTLFTVVIQEDIRGFTWSDSDTDIAQFLYFLVGVALREETIKLLCFAPLILWLRKRNDPVEALILAGMVGLGFAVNENIGYFERTPENSQISWSRLLTANPLHYSLTGVAGYYLANMIRRKGHGMEEFLIAFIAVVFAHGIYNAVISIPSFLTYAPLSTILVAVIAYQYFDRLKETMDISQVHRRISPLGVFILGSAVLTCLAMMTSAASQSMSIAFRDFASGVAGLIPLAFAFISRFRDL